MKESDTILSLLPCLYKHRVIKQLLLLQKKANDRSLPPFISFSLSTFTHTLSLCKLELSLICMAANSSSRGIVSLGKRVVNEIRARDSTQLSALTLRYLIWVSSCFTGIIFLGITFDENILRFCLENLRESVTGLVVEYIACYWLCDQFGLLIILFDVTEKSCDLSCLMVLEFGLILWSFSIYDLNTERRKIK